MAISLQDAVQSAQEAARIAGELLLTMQSSVQAQEKAPRDLVTEADLASQRAIQEKLHDDFPEIRFIGEEDVGPGPLVLPTNEDCWIVDPLDGTTNYVHGMPTFSVSIGLCRQNEVVLGVVFDPMRDHMYWAIRDQGAFRNDTPISVSKVVSLHAALLAASFPARVQPGSAEIARFNRVLCQCQALRRLGSAALNMCYVAAGQLDGYWATSVKLWDIAAGLLLISEAGGTITAIDGTPLRLDDPRLVATSTIDLHHRLLAELNMATDQ